jgi:electron transport complex protein RnfD
VRLLLLRLSLEPADRAADPAREGGAPEDPDQQGGVTEMTSITFEKLKITSSPHLRTKESVPRIMWTVNAVLAPVAVFAVYWYGWRALLTTVLCVGAAAGTEALIQKFRKVEITVGDGSAVLTGLLFAYVMPANQPWFVSVIGSAFAIGIAKHTFGGLGNNIWNPALVARAFVLAAWPAFTILGASWPRPGPEATPVTFDLNGAAAITAPSPLTDPEVPKKRGPDAVAEMTKAEALTYWEDAVETNLLVATGQDPADPEASRGQAYLMLLLGKRNGCLGETAGLLIILGGLILLWRGYINWRVPFFFILSALALGWVLPEKIRWAGGTLFSPWFSGDPLRHLLSGGLLLGAFFMATDMVTSPVSNKGAIIFAVGCGLLTALIRLYGGYPEGVCYSIILMNTAVPLIDRHTRPRTYGEVEA